MTDPKRPRALINGFGRIGRLAMRRALGAVGAASGARAACYDTPFDIVAINDPLAVAETAAYLLQFDSVQGAFGTTSVAANGDAFTVVTPKGEEKTIAFSRHSRVEDLPIADLGIDIVLECSGKFLTRAALQPALDAGAKAVVVSAPIDEKEGAPVLNVVYGVNHDAYDGEDPVVTAASCTTNCLAPIVKVIHSTFGITRGAITTIHDVTNTQTIVDAANTKKSDLRRARSGMVNLAPTSTGSAKAIALVFPDLEGKLNGLAVRVPLLNGSIVDGVFEVGRATTVEEVNAALEAAANGELAGVLGFETRPLVSADYTGDSRSGIVDAACTQVVDGVLVKVYAWYDNEWGYSCRYVDVASMVATKRCRGA